MLRQFTSLGRDQRWLYLSSVLWGFGIALYLYIQPLYIASLGATPEQIGLVLGVSGLAVTFLYIPIGLWADRRGRKPVMLAGWGLGAVATLAIALAPDWRWLIPAMIAYMLSNFAMPAFNGYVAAGSRPEDLGRTVAILATSNSIGSIVSPAIGGWIGEHYGLRMVYLCAAVAFMLSTLALVPIRHQPPAPAAGARAHPRQLLSSPRFLWQILFILFLFFAVDLGQVMAPKFLQDVRGLTVQQIGWLGTVGSLGIVTLSVVFGHMRVERPWALVLAQGAALAATVILLRSPLAAFMVAAYFIHGSNRVVRPLVIGRLARSLETSTMSFGYGFYETAMRLGLALSPYVAGLLYARGPVWPLCVGIACVAGTILLTFTQPVGLRARVAAPAKLAEHPGD
jgi:predicted MFS family arabinose efflux permease